MSGEGKRKCCPCGVCGNCVGGVCAGTLTVSFTGLQVDIGAGPCSWPSIDQAVTITGASGCFWVWPGNTFEPGCGVLSNIGLVCKPSISGPTIPPELFADGARQIIRIAFFFGAAAQPAFSFYSRPPGNPCPLTGTYPPVLQTPGLDIFIVNPGTVTLS